MKAEHEIVRSQSDVIPFNRKPGLQGQAIATIGLREATRAQRRLCIRSAPYEYRKGYSQFLLRSVRWRALQCLNRAHNIDYYPRQNCEFKSNTNAFYLHSAPHAILFATPMLDPFLATNTWRHASFPHPATLGGDGLASFFPDLHPCLQLSPTPEVAHLEYSTSAIHLVSNREYCHRYFHRSRSYM